MLPRFDAGQALKTLQRVKATAMPGVPTMYQALLDNPAVKRPDGRALCLDPYQPPPCIADGDPRVMGNQIIGNQHDIVIERRADGQCAGAAGRAGASVKSLLDNQRETAGQRKPCL